MPIQVLNPNAEADRVLRGALLLTLFLFALRLVMAARLEIIPDEAYYWIWSKDLATGYYDHPPMVAYWIRLGTAIFGDNVFGVRFWFVASFLADAWLLLRIVMVLFDEPRLAAWSAIFFSASVIAPASVIASPDPPLILFWLLASYGLARIAKGGSPSWWLMIGASAGLAVDSKYTAFFLGISIVLWIAIVPAMRVHWRRWQLYAGGVLAGLAFLPVLLWNAGHDWASFAKQFGRIDDGAFNLRFLAEYLGIYFVIATPLIGVLSVVGLATALRQRGWHDPAVSLLVALSLPLAAYFVLHSFHQRVEGNWIVPIVLSGVVFAAIGMTDARYSQWPGLLRALRLGAAPVGLLLGLYIIAAGIFPAFPPDSRIDPLTRFKGWQAFVRSADEVRRSEGASHFVIKPYGVVGEFRFNLRGVPVVTWGDGQRWKLFPAVVPPPGPGLVISDRVARDIPLLEAAFGRVTRLPDLQREVAGTRFPYAAFLVAEPKARAARAR